MARDLYDSVYLFGRTEPDMRYFLLKQGTDDRLELAPFLPDRKEVLKVKLFPEILRNLADGVSGHP